MTAIVLDVVTILMLVFFIIIGAKRGFVRSVIGFLGMVISLFVSFYLSSFLSNLIYDHFIKQQVINQIDISIASGNVSYDTIASALPENLYNSFSYYGITPDKINHIINSGKGNIALSIANLISPIFITLIRMCVILTFFFILMPLFSGLASTVSGIFKLPVLSGIDASLGAVFGILKGYLAVTLIIFCVKTIGQVMYNPEGIFLYSDVESTFVFKHFYTNNLVYNLLSEV